MATVSYSLVMVLAIAAGAVVKALDPQKLPLPARDRFFLGLGAFTGGMLGAKLPYVLLDPQGFLTGSAWLENGKTILAGLAGGYFGVEYVKWIRHITVKTGDTFAVPLAVALAIGRIACFIGGCCYGTETTLPWGHDFGDHVLRHPTQIYESIFHISAAWMMWNLRRKNRFSGLLLKSYYLAYFVYRFFTEWIRPEPKLLWGFTPYQTTAAFLFIVFGVLLLRDLKLRSEPLPQTQLLR